MDAKSHLRGLGWRGPGHSLDSHTTNRGLAKPLLLRKNAGNTGLGAAHDVGDQWWMRAFDDSLKNMGSGKETVLEAVRRGGVARNGLMGFFVSGGYLEGTLEDQKGSETPSEVEIETPPDVGKKYDRYVARAAEKGVSVEEYLKRRRAKKARKGKRK